MKANIFWVILSVVLAVEVICEIDVLPAQVPGDLDIIIVDAQNKSHDQTSPQHSDQQPSQSCYCQPFQYQQNPPQSYHPHQFQYPQNPYQSYYYNPYQYSQNPPQGYYIYQIQHPQNPHQSYKNHDNHSHEEKPRSAVTPVSNSTAIKEHLKRPAVTPVSNSTVIKEHLTRPAVTPVSNSTVIKEHLTGNQTMKGSLHKTRVKGNNTRKNTAKKLFDALFKKPK